VAVAMICMLGQYTCAKPRRLQSAAGLVPELSDSSAIRANDREPRNAVPEGTPENHIRLPGNDKPGFQPGLSKT
jgi:hypothetical protein